MPVALQAPILGIWRETGTMLVRILAVAAMGLAWSGPAHAQSQADQADRACRSLNGTESKQDCPALLALGALGRVLVISEPPAISSEPVLTMDRTRNCTSRTMLGGQVQTSCY